VVRKPEEGWFTCLGGGFVASGEPGWDRIPKPFDSSLKLSGFEATGEVQTPVQSSSDLQIGDSVIFRHAKAGEVMERFNQVVLIENGSVTGSAKTYRGYGECYF
jgi:D-serine deaminase-like pyridoxal phosphate-dependent protein